MALAFPEAGGCRDAQGRHIGGGTILTRMAELMFIEALRHHFEATARAADGWLAGLKDPIVGQALTRLHERPAHPWTLPELAQGIASSRTVVVERFTRIVGDAAHALSHALAPAAGVRAVGQRIEQGRSHLDTRGL